MYRKNQEKEGEAEEGAPQTIFPKFTPNWVQVVRFDRIVMNVSGTSSSTQTVNTKSSPRSARNSSGRSRTIRTILSGTCGGLIGMSSLKFS